MMTYDWQSCVPCRDESKRPFRGKDNEEIQTLAVNSKCHFV